MACYTSSQTLSSSSALFTVHIGPTGHWWEVSDLKDYICTLQHKKMEDCYRHDLSFTDFGDNDRKSRFNVVMSVHCKDLDLIAHQHCEDGKSQQI